MDGYNATIQITKQKPQYPRILEKCAEAHRIEQKKQYCLGFQWHDVGVEPAILRTLCTKYDFLTVTHKTNKKTYYMVKDIDGVEKALKDIEAKKTKIECKNNLISILDAIISSWPEVNRRLTKTQIVFSIGNKNFCWLSYKSSMVQLSPPLGQKSITRFIKRDGHEVNIIRRKTKEIEMVYDDPLHLLGYCWSFPGFRCKGNLAKACLDLPEYLILIRQSYKNI